MNKTLKRSALLLLLLCSSSVFAQKVRNVILLIPDGCSLATVSTARWYQWMMNPDAENLYIDPYLCGTVRTTCSNAPIGDSAPTTSTYMTGYNSLAGWVSTYPTADPENDIYPMDPTKAYQPLTTVLEAARLMYGKSTGLVCTCEFPHATPADCSSHSYNRSKYEWIMPQQAHNGINVIIGGGAGILPKDCEAYLKEKGYGIFKNDIAGMRSYQGDNMWALFAHQDMAFDIDRNPAKEPSLAEMTHIAIEKLNHNPNGFFLMVEGSKVDWAAHTNDPASMITDFIAFDKACHEAIEFAKKDGNTAVIIVPDHGNSGLSIGRRDWGDYAKTPKNKMFGAMMRFKASSDVVADRLNRSPNSEVQNIFKELCGFELTERELQALNNCSEYKSSPIPKDQRKPLRGALYSSGLSRMVAQFMTERTGLAYTTNGHTGEDVFLAAYHPQQEKRPYGMLTNIQLNEYLCNLIGTTHSSLDSLTAENFVANTLIDIPSQITTEKVGDKDIPKLIFSKSIKGKKLELHIMANSNQVQLVQRKGKNIVPLKTYEMPCPAVYVDKNNTFYVYRNQDQFFEL